MMLWMTKDTENSRKYTQWALTFNLLVGMGFLGLSIKYYIFISDNTSTYVLGLPDYVH
jgi:hypothetical protein